MKTRILLSMMLFASSVVCAQTIEVSGSQSGIWDADTVLVTDDVTVEESLLVKPGTVVLFNGFHSILVQDGAVFIARGTQNDSIRFTVADTTGLFNYDNGKGGWNGFQLYKAGKVRFNYCVLEYAKAADTTDKHGGAMRIDVCDDVVISHSTLRCNRAREHGGAISAKDSHVVMTDCRVNDNVVFTKDNLFYMYGGGLRFLKCDVELKGMEFRRNYAPSCVGGALSLDSCSVVLDRAVFTENIGVNGAGLYLMRSNHKDCRLSNLLFDHNYSVHFGGGLAFCDVSPDVYNILVTNNDSGGVACSGIFFYQYCAPKMNNCIVYGNLPGPEALNADTVQMWLWTFEDYAPEFRNCLIEGGTKYIRGSEYIKVFDNIIDDDPCFVDVEGRDFRLRENSPCRDAGLREVPDFLANGLDLAGNQRISNMTIDIGPYEYFASSVSQIDSESQGIKLSGNPLNAKSRIEFDRDLECDVTVTVYSLTGRCAARKAFVMARTRYLEIGGLVEQLASGVYLIEVVADGQVYGLKAVK